MAFDAPTIAEILTKIVREMPPPATSLAAELPPAIDDVIARAIAKDKAVRFETPSALVEAALAAFSVSGTCAEWASRTEAELRAALSAAASATRHARVDPGRTPPSPIPEARSRAIGPEASSLPPDRAGGSRLALLAGLAVLGVLVASGIAVALLHLVL
jgi:serine/threonine-protein kinase